MVFLQDKNDRECMLCALNMMERGGPEPAFLGDFSYHCRICGRYYITEKAIYDGIAKHISFHYLQGYVRYRSDTSSLEVRITDDNILEISASPVIANNVFKKTDRLLLDIFKKTLRLGETVIYSYNEDYTVAFTLNDSEFKWLIGHLEGKKYVEAEHSDPTVELCLTSLGREKVEMLNNDPVETNMCFVAMSFDPSLDKYYDKAIAPAVRETGFAPYRMDREEHAELIPFKMLAEIKKSRFVIADFTKHRGSVYFEAGYALALDLPVIWICSQKDFDKAHFDIKQFNHIIYTGLDDLHKKLKLRIEAIIL